MLLNRLPLHLLPPRAVLLAADIVLLLLPKGDAAERRFLSGVEPPYGTVEITGLNGPARIAAFRPSHRQGDSDHLLTPSDINDGEDYFGPIVLGSDIDEVVDALDLTSRRRVLGFLLGFCRKAFEVGNDPDFASSCLKLAQRCGLNKAEARQVATVSPAWTVLDGIASQGESAVYVVGPKHVRRGVLIPLDGSNSLHLTERTQANDTLIALGDHPAMWALSATTITLPDLIRPNPHQAELRAACLRALGPISPTISAQVRELSLFAPATPVKHDDVRQPVGAVLEAALPDSEGGIFLRGWLRDPLQLVRAAELHGPCGSTVIELDQLQRFRRPDIDRHYANASFAGLDARLGFAAHLADPGQGMSSQPDLVLHLHSGSRVVVRPPLRHPTAAAARAAVLTSVLPDDVTDRMIDVCLGPAAAAFHRTALAQPRQPELIQIGPPISDPIVSVIIPLYRNLSFLRFQIAAFAADPALRAAELLFVLDSPEQRHEAEHLLRGLHALHALPITLLVMPCNMGYAAANNTGATYARASELLLLNSDVIPVRPGWLSQMRAGLSSIGIGAVGPKLLFDDGSIQHAGLYFDRSLDGVWFNAHYDKGMPRHWPTANRARKVPGVTGAALLVRKALFDEVGGVCEDYIIGDYEDSDLCLRLRRAGAEIVYEPNAELFHFERKSIELHKGYTGTLASRYNRRLHHRRWDKFILDLMATPEYRAEFAREAA